MYIKYQRINLFALPLKNLLLGYEEFAVLLRILHLYPALRRSTKLLIAMLSNEL